MKTRRMSGASMSSIPAALNVQPDEGAMIDLYRRSMEAQR
jgi:hypothetical protein